MSQLSKGVERSVKRLVLGSLSRVSSTSPVPLDLSTVEKVLFVRANFRMGNLLLVTPALAAARRALPAARLDLLGTPTYEALLAHHPDVDGLLHFARGMLLRPTALAELLRKIRAQRYDLVIDCARGGSVFGAALCGLSGGRFRVAAEGSRYRRFFNLHVPRRPHQHHKIVLLLDLLDGIGIPPVTREMRIVLTDAERSQASERWEALGLPDAAAVGILVGGRGKKRVPTRDLLETMVRLRERGSHVVLLVGPEDGHLAYSLYDALPRGTRVVPPLGLRDFAALLARFAVVVSADTGPMHLAVALGVPTVAVLRASASLSYRPLGAQHRVLFDQRGSAPGAIVSAVEDVLATAATNAVAAADTALRHDRAIH